MLGPEIRSDTSFYRPYAVLSSTFCYTGRKQKKNPNFHLSMEAAKFLFLVESYIFI